MDMINSLLSFGAKNVSPEILEQTLTVRGEIVNEIEKNCVTKTKNQTTWQSLLIAPRGSGKTHLTKVLYHRLKNNKDISGRSVIAYMSEDEVGIADFTDLMVSMLRAFVRYGELGSDTLEEQIKEASLVRNSDQRQIFVKNILKSFAGNRIIILLIENFDKILESLKENGQRNLRDFVHQYNNLSIIATSQNLIADIQNSQNPFYNFFNVSQLKKLTFQESVSFIQEVATAEKKIELADEIGKEQYLGKLRAIYELTEGNHRLLVTFYSFLKADFKSELSGVFVKVMNDLKPYYEQFINNLQRQQQKIVKNLSINRGAVSGKGIAIACFIEPNVISKQLSLLFEKGMIDKNKSGKDVFYELKEPLLRICFEISENPNGLSRLFVDFLCAYYDSKTIKSQYLKYRYGAKFQEASIKCKYENEALFYSLALNEDDIEKISFSHKLFDRIESLSELDNMIHKDNDWVMKNIDNAYENFKKGNALADEGKYEEAIGSFMRSIEVNPQNDTAYFSLGKIYLKLEDTEKALDYLQRAIDINPNNSMFYLAQGVSYSLNSEYRKAIEAYKKSLKIDTNNHRAYILIGLTYSQLKDYDKAIEHFNKSLEIDSDSTHVYIFLGDVYKAMGQIHDAIVFYQKSLEFDDNNINVYNKLGKLQEEINKTDDAIECYKKALLINAMDFKTTFNLGLIYAKSVKYDEALKYLIEAYSLNSDSYKVCYNLGLVYAQKRDFTKSVEYFKKSLEIDSENDLPYVGLAIIHLFEGKYEETINHCNYAIQLNSKRVETYMCMIYAYNALGNFKKVLEISKLLLQNDPKNEDLYDEIGMAYSNLGKIEKAISSFNSGLKINSNNYRLSFHLLGLYIRMNNLSKSKKIVISQKKKVDVILLSEFLTEDIFYNLFKYGSDAFIYSFLDFLIKLVVKEKFESALWKSLPQSLFNVLISIEDYDKERLAYIENNLSNLLSGFEESLIPLKMFKTGIAYLKNDERNAIYKLSKEERTLFNEAVIESRRK